MIEIIVIPLTILAALATLLWFVIGAKGKWWLKVPVIAITLMFSVFIWGVINNLLGWPTNQDLPNKYRLHWAVVEEPGIKHNKDGAIFLLCSNLDTKERKRIVLGHKVKTQSPRLYEIPYSKEAHKQIQGLKAKLRKGMVVTMGRGMKGGKGGKGKGKGKGRGRKGKGKSGNGEGGGSFSGESPTPLGYELPPPKYPDKEGNEQ